MKKNITIGAIIVILAFGLLIWLVDPGSSSSEKDLVLSPAEKAVVYKTPTCGCCSVYTKYLPAQGVKTESINISNQELNEMQLKYKISNDLASCHITIIGDYFVSGHIPVEAIEKLASEKPNIAGIALAGMPSGTPGMPGSKNESWVIYAIDDNGSTSEFMTI